MLLLIELLNVLIDIGVFIEVSHHMHCICDLSIKNFGSEKNGAVRFCFYIRYEICGNLRIPSLLGNKLTRNWDSRICYELGLCY